MYGRGKLARIYGVLPLLCSQCGGEMRIIAFITEAVVIREILGHLGEPTSPPRLLPARGRRCGRCRAASLMKLLMKQLAIPLSAMKHLEEVLVPGSANSTRGCALSGWL